MSSYRYTSDLVDDVLFRAGEPTDGTSDLEAAALRYINRAYQAIWQGGQELAPDVNEDWLWLTATRTLTLVPPVEGTVTVTKNSASIAFSSPPTDPNGSAISVTGWYIRTIGHPDVFKISAHTSGQTAATIDSVYTGESGTKTYTAFDVEYGLSSDVLRLRSPMYVRSSAQHFPYRPGEISIVSLETLRTMYPLEFAAAGVPTMAALLDENSVRFNTYPSNYLRVEYDFLAAPSDLTNGDNEEPAVPRKDRRILADAALGFMFRDKGDPRADSLFQQAANHLRAMANENRARLLRGDRSFARLYPRLDRMSRIGPSRTSGGLIVG